MDRTLVYAGQVPRALDNLQLGEYAMVGLAQLASAILGTNTIVSQGGFAVSPGGGLNIAVAPGQVYQLQSIEPTVESALNVDGRQVLKQGIALNAQTLTLAPPNTVGYAQNFLLQVAYNDVPDGLTVLSFQNPTPVLDPSTNTYKYVTYPGPGGNGQASYTILRGGVSVIAKPGSAAPSGSQSTPAPDAGYVGLYVITLAYGATSVGSGNILPYANAPFIPVTLPGVPAGVQAGTWTFGQDTGSADNYAVTLSPNNGAPIANQRVFVKFSNANATTSPVFSLNGTPARALLKRDGSAPAVGDVSAQSWRWVFFDGTSWRFEGALPSDTNATNVAQAAKALFNVQKQTVQTRMSASSSISGQNVVVLSGLSYVKKSTTSIILAWLTFQTYTPGTTGAITMRLSVGSGFADVGLTNGYTPSGSSQPIQLANTPVLSIAGVGAGAQAITLAFRRDDNSAWTTVLNPTSADVSGYPTPNTLTLIISEVEPS